ncbi:hypothetical protein D9M68_498790 [compost metagenome]
MLSATEAACIPATFPSKVLLPLKEIDDNSLAFNVVDAEVVISLLATPDPEITTSCKLVCSVCRVISTLFLCPIFILAFSNPKNETVNSSPAFASIAYTPKLFVLVCRFPVFIIAPGMA